MTHTGFARPLYLMAGLQIGVLTSTFVLGCRQAIIRGADRSVYGLIADRQRAALGSPSDPDIGAEKGELGQTDRMYDFSPRPVESEVPEAFRSAPRESTPTSAPTSISDTDISPTVFAEAQRNPILTFGICDALGYAMQHARGFQNAKEDLYLAALALTLERHLWTPQFVGSVKAEYANYGQVRDFDHAMSAVSDVAVTQRLPFGGEVSAHVINSLMRDLGAHVTSAETGSAILQANIPLLRGAGRSAYESRYTAERNLIYAVRTFEHFRRSFLVEVAAAYFNLQQSKAAIANTFQSYKSRKQDWEKADFINRMGQSKTIFEAPRAKSSLRQAEAALVSAKEQYASALDRFKVFIGMQVEALLDVVDQDADEESKNLDDLLPDVEIAVALDVALHDRLDLLNSADGVDDARRGTQVAKNRILPDLDASGSLALDTDPAQKNSTSYNTERATWRGGLEMRLDDRKTERNAYREALISLRRAERNHDQLADDVRADVRRALRRVAQQANLRTIQTLNVEENEMRLQAARAQFDLGKSTNQDVVDAENDLLAARNQYSGAVAAYRNAILEFRRDTGTLRVTDEGRWEPPAEPPPEG